MPRAQAPFTVVDLFSGVGGMSHGFFRNPRFRIVGAADLEVGKPSSGVGSLRCNDTYFENHGVCPVAANLAEIAPTELARRLFGRKAKRHFDVLIACAPCTGFSRVNSQNHLRDDPRNSLVARSALFVKQFKPSIFVMENARELLRGKFTHHFHELKRLLEGQGYNVRSEVHRMDSFGLPQIRERAIVIAVRKGLPNFGLSDLWEGYQVVARATTIRRAIAEFPKIAAGEAHLSDPYHMSPGFSAPLSLRRLQAIPRNGGSWVDILKRSDHAELLTPAMRKYADYYCR